MSFDAVSLALVWLFVGALIWALFNPNELTDIVERSYLTKYRRLPSAWLLYVVHVLAILTAPLVIPIWLRNLHRRVWR